MRDARALAFRHLPDGFAGRGLDRHAVEFEGDALCHFHLTAVLPASSRTAPKGPVDCSYGWSAAEPVDRSLPHSGIAPEGRRSCETGTYRCVRDQFLRPSGADTNGNRLLHGFRCASPVATAQGPSGANVDTQRRPEPQPEVSRFSRASIQVARRHLELRGQCRHSALTRTSTWRLAVQSGVNPDRRPAGSTLARPAKCPRPCSQTSSARPAGRPRRRQEEQRPAERLHGKSGPRGKQRAARRGERGQQRVLRRRVQRVAAQRRQVGDEDHRADGAGEILDR